MRNREIVLGGWIKLLLTAVSLLLLIVFYLVLSGCTMLLMTDDFSYSSIVKTDKLLLIVKDELYSSLEYSIDQYVQDLDEEGCSVSIFIWQNGTAYDLKNILNAYYTDDNIGGALLIGDLPSVWYEMYSFNRYEEFPCDLFFMDFNAAWEDTDNDEILDYHSALNLEIFISRIKGTSEELCRYFEKVHRYRMDEFEAEKIAYIFKDNDWADFNKGSSFQLNDIYDSIEICEAPDETEKSNYISKLTGYGAEFVYQWIHAYPPLLCIEGNESFSYIHTSKIGIDNLKGLFYNLFNCSASRFTENNIGMTYLMKTDYGLATMGSTKVGGNYYPKVFHGTLSRNHTWGDAYRAWYNNYGVTDDEWFMGMVILGDPMLVVTKEVPRVLKKEPMTVIPPGVEEIEDLNNIFQNFMKDYWEGSFEEYKNSNPQFFEG